ncbi:MAG TPA: methyltransferase [archaeon]|nr:methyltransferase [archaeon]
MIWKRLKIESGSEVYPPKPASLLLARIAAKIAAPNQKILDACCGSGIVAIAVAKFVPKSNVIASDINSEAILTTKKNAKKNRANVLAIQSDLFAEFSDCEFDLITIHPPAVPYLPGKNWGMSNGMGVATNGGIDGSELVIRSILEAKRCLKKNGRLLLLLPHWCNTKKAFKELYANYKNVSKLAEKRIEFFPATTGNPEKEMLEHAYRLAKKGQIRIEFKNGKPYSYASVIMAVK